MDWVLLSVLSVIGFTAVTIVQKRTLDRYARGAVPFNAAAAIIQLIIAVVLLLISPPNWFSSAALLMVLTGSLHASVFLLQLYALNRETDISRIVPILDSFPLVVLIIAVGFLGEVLTPIKWMAVLMVTAGAMLASYHQSISGERLRLNRSLGAIIGAMVGIALLSVLFKIGSTELEVTQMVGLTWLFAAPVHLSVARFAHAGKDVRAVFRSRPAIAWVGLTQIFLLLAMLSGIAAVSIGPLSLSSAIMGTRPVILLLWFMASGFSFRKVIRSEPGQPRRKQWASASLVTVGVGAMAF